MIAINFKIYHYDQTLFLTFYSIVCGVISTALDQRREIQIHTLQPAVPDSQNILTTGMKLRIIFLLHNTSSSHCTGR